ALFPDGGPVALGLEDGTVALRVVPGGGEVARLRGHNSPVDALAVGLDGRRLVSYDHGGTIKIWEPAGPGGWTCLKALAGDRPAIDWDIHRVFLALSADGKHLAACAAGASAVSWWDLAGDAPVAQVRVPGKEKLHCLALSPDGRLLAAGYSDGAARGVFVWDTGTRQLRTAGLAVLHYPRQIAFSPDGRSLAAACGDGGLVVWDTADWQRRLFVGGDHPIGVAFSPDSQLLAITPSETGLIRFWHLASNREVAVLRH